MKTKSQLILEAYANANGYDVYVKRDKTEFFESCPYYGAMCFDDAHCNKTLDPVVVNVFTFGETVEQVWNDMLAQLIRTVNKTEDELMVSMDIN